MRLTVMGTGYVGLVAGACFADAGQDVVCVDADARKIEALQQGHLPIYEQGLAEVVARAVDAGRLRFATTAAAAIAGSDVVFVAVGTPSGAHGEADLDAVFDVAREVARHATGPTLLVLKSTVPVRTNARVTALLQELGATHVEVVSNPEFLKEGTALEDFQRPDRVVVGARSERAAAVLRVLYEPFCRNGGPMHVMDPASAEITKYAANAMLATRVSFMNTVADLCEAADANVDHVRRGVGSDRRIGPLFLSPGIGYGGSCFPKDVQALAATAREFGRTFGLLDEVQRQNAAQKRVLVRKLERAFEPLGGLAGRTFALWGLTFKANTDDLRESPALVVIEELLARGARVRAHDPVAMDRARAELATQLGQGLSLVATRDEAVPGADALVIATDWDEYRRPDFDRLRGTLRRPWIFDGRNLWCASHMAELGIHYRSVGRPDVVPAAEGAEREAPRGEAACDGSCC